MLRTQPIKFLADCDIKKYNISQQIAKFKAGRINLPANIGKDNNNKIAVIKIAHTNKGIWWSVNPGARILITVLIKFIAPNNEDIPARCNENIAKSTAPPAWEIKLDKGG